MVRSPGFGEEHEFDTALDIFDGDEAHRLAGFGGVGTDDFDTARHADFFLVASFTQLRRKITDEFGQHFLVGRERVVGEVHADEFALPVEGFAAIHVLDIGQADVFDHARARAEQAHLSGVGGAEVRAADSRDALHAGE